MKDKKEMVGNWERDLKFISIMNYITLVALLFITVLFTMATVGWLIKSGGTDPTTAVFAVLGFISAVGTLLFYHCYIAKPRK